MIIVRFILVIPLVLYASGILAEQTFYEKVTEKVITMAQPEGTKVDTNALETAQDAGRMFLGSSQTSDAALERIKARNSSMSQNSSEKNTTVASNIASVSCAYPHS